MCHQLLLTVTHARTSVEPDSHNNSPTNPCVISCSLNSCYQCQTWQSRWLPDNSVQYTKFYIHVVNTFFSFYETHSSSPGSAKLFKGSQSKAFLVISKLQSGKLKKSTFLQSQRILLHVCLYMPMAFHYVACEKSVFPEPYAEIHFNINDPLTSISLTDNHKSIPYFPCLYYMSCPSNHPWFTDLNYITKSRKGFMLFTHPLGFNSLTMKWVCHGCNKHRILNTPLISTTK
jgi:hypothetical protein